jgi:hypothetical protein
LEQKRADENAPLRRLREIKEWFSEERGSGWVPRVVAAVLWNNHPANLHVFPSEPQKQRKPIPAFPTAAPEQTSTGHNFLTAQKI